MREYKDHFFGRHYEARHATGPIAALNPTTRYMSIDHKSPETTVDATNEPQQQQQDDSQGSQQSAQPLHRHKRDHHGATYLWRSRDNRKGRHAVVVAPSYHDAAEGAGPKRTDTFEATLRGLGKMVTRYPIWDVSYDVATVFTLGSVIWVVNGFFSWLPLAAPSTEFSGESTWAGGLTAFIGATVFEFGSILLMLEAVNENRSDCFGWALEEGMDSMLSLVQEDEKECVHSHKHKRSWLKGRHHHVTANTGGASTGKSADSDDGGSNGAGAAGGAGTGSTEHAADDQHPSKGRTWSWWPSLYELRTHYIRDVGFLACSSQMFGATIFWISGFTALPPILNKLTLGQTNGAYWLPQVIGGMGFVVSSTLFMVEVQPKWYIPAPKVLGWHIGLWNLIGAIGFTLCGALGFDAADTSVNYALALSTFIGSWAFLIGSVIQWYESLDKYPLWVDNSLGASTGPAAES